MSKWKKSIRKASAVRGVRYMGWQDLYEPRRIENPFSKTRSGRVSWSSGEPRCVFEKTGLLVTPSSRCEPREPRESERERERERERRAAKNKCV